MRRSAGLGYAAGFLKKHVKAEPATAAQDRKIETLLV